MRANVVIRISNWRNLRRPLVDYARETHIRNIRFPSFNQSHHCFVALPLSFLKFQSNRKHPLSFCFRVVSAAPVAEKLWGQLFRDQPKTVWKSALQLKLPENGDLKITRFKLEKKKRPKAPIDPIMYRQHS